MWCAVHIASGRALHFGIFFLYNFFLMSAKGDGALLPVGFFFIKVHVALVCTLHP